MGIESMKDEAAQCRRRAAEFAGKPEAAFLMRVATSFDDLAQCRIRSADGLKSGIRSGQLR